MNQKSESYPAIERDWLETLYNDRRRRSLELGIKSITILKSEGKTISYRTVATKSKEIDPEGRGIHQNTIINNKELHDYFLQYSTNKTYKGRRKSNKPLLEDLDTFKHIKLDRDLERVRQRYLQLTKPELVELIIRMEQYISHQNQIWLKNEFEKFQ